MITFYRNRNPRKRIYFRTIDGGIALCTPHFDIAIRWTRGRTRRR